MRRRFPVCLAVTLTLAACSPVGTAEVSSRVMPAVGANPFTDAAPYAPGSPEALQAAKDHPGDAEALRRVSAGTGALWLGEGSSAAAAGDFAHQANDTGQTAVIVLYAIPDRDCGSHSAGGAEDAEQYQSWVSQIATAIDGTHVALIVEPDALAADCYDEQRAQILRSAVDTLASTSASIYLDAGNSGWRSPEEMSERLREVGVEKVRGFAVNVSNFYSTDAERTYANRIVADLGGGHYVIDTSRNGARVEGWCNPEGARLGELPGTSTQGNQDANLWIKTPGRSDGECNGGPAAGEFWLDYAVQLGQ